MNQVPCCFSAEGFARRLELSSPWGNLFYPVSSEGLPRRVVSYAFMLVCTCFFLRMDMVENLSVKLEQNRQAVGAFVFAPNGPSACNAAIVPQAIPAPRR